MKKTLTKFFCIICIISASAQNLSQEYLDTLGDEELLTLFDKFYGDSVPNEQIALTYLNRAKKEDDTIKMARGYDRLARIFYPEKNRVFADSIIELTRGYDNITYPALGYMLKGFYYYSENNIKNSMENYSRAYEISKLRGNVKQQLVVSDLLIYYKSIWGNKKEALELQKERHELLMSDYYIQEVKKATRKTLNTNSAELHLEDEILSIQNFIFCHLNLKHLDSAEMYINQANYKLKTYLGNSKKVFDIWLLEASIEIAYYKKQYPLAIKLSDSLLNSQSVTQGSLMNIFFFKGLSQISANDYQSGIETLKKSDSIFDFSKSKIPLQPYKRQLFEELLRYYQSLNNKTKSIEYLNKLLSLDSIFKINYKYFEPQYIKQFETPKLLKEKEALITSLKKKNHNFKKINWWIIGVLATSLTFMFYYLNRQLLYKKRFKKLFALNNEVKQLSEEDRKHGISSEVVDDILRKLRRFEGQKQFLTQNLSLQFLAKKFHTNSNYLSRVINLKMEKNFSQYIHDLRIEYSMSELLSNSKFRNYTIKAIAEDCGYTNAESYSRAFYKKNGIYPSYYIKKLNQTEA